MARIVWRESYNLGDARIDAQHQKIAQLINRLDDVLHGEASSSMVGSVLEELVDYTRRHFADEETLMAEMQFDGISEHKEEHRAFVDRTREFIGKFLQGDRDIAQAMSDFLSGWLVHHICDVDTQYKPLLDQRHA